MERVRPREVVDVSIAPIGRTNRHIEWHIVVGS